MGISSNVKALDLDPWLVFTIAFPFFRAVLFQVWSARMLLVCELLAGIL